MQTTENDRSVMYNSEPMTFLEPYARYDVVVIASTSVGNSTVTMDSITTPQGGEFVCSSPSLIIASTF